MTKHMTIRITDSEKEALAQFASDTDTTQSEVIRKALQAYIKDFSIDEREQGKRVDLKILEVLRDIHKDTYMEESDYFVMRGYAPSKSWTRTIVARLESLGVNVKLYTRLDNLDVIID